MSKHILPGELKSRPYGIWIILSCLIIFYTPNIIRPQENVYPTPPPIYDRRNNVEGWEDAAAQTATELITWAEGDRARIMEAMQNWSDPTMEVIGRIKPNGVFYRYDLDQDGALEYLLGLPIAIGQEAITCTDFRCPRMLYLFEQDENGFTLAHTFAADDPVIPWIEGGDIFEIGDLTADGLTEVVIRSSWCGVHTCGVDLRVGRWDGANWLPLGTMGQTYTEIRLQNVDLDAAVEFVFTGGFVGSAGAGPQREHTHIYDWDGSAYVLTAAIVDEVQDPYFLMLDAHAALKRGHYLRTIEVAMQVVNFADEDYEQPGLEPNGITTQNTRAYAAALAAIAYIQLGEPGSAEVVLSEFTSLEGAQVTAVFATQEFWHVYQESIDLNSACEAMEAILVEEMVQLEGTNESLFLDFVGYNTETISDDKLCTFTVENG